LRDPEPLVPAHAYSPQAVNETPRSSALAPQYQAWLDQDVRWLIQPQERAVFFQLSSDAERDHFIQQFWERRNSPGSAPNSYRAEHYRRIAYANQHFAAAGLAGWEADRGRIYIVNGAPSRINSYPSSAAPYGHPYETWGYAAMQFTFVDFCDCGKYQLLAQSSTSGRPPTSAAER
jgi:GWxTD domain-containing protein